MQREIGGVTDPSGPTGHRLRRRLRLAALVLAWIALLCADAANGPGPWLWAAVAATWAALALIGTRVHLRRHRYVEHPA
jgi:hypothetical protein